MAKVGTVGEQVKVGEVRKGRTIEGVTLTKGRVIQITFEQQPNVVIQGGGGKENLGSGTQARKIVK